jgi:uncharacterized protein YndB with AHSA1/START domain
VDYFRAEHKKNQSSMKNKNFTTSILVGQSPAEVFKAVNNPRAWWNEDIDGRTDQLNDQWSYRFEDTHRCKVKITDMVPNERVVWHVEDNYFKFTKDPSEWTGNDITFEISKKGTQTQLLFTQVGLVPANECYEVCRDAWTGFIDKSLRSLIVTGKGALDWYLES